ncbi:membrane fusion protein, multidrug efflux system [Rhizobiales bacterium GAS113]|nr:membrane fusion protein, multidrug efflux system [Rhizobiales bacterium GAS113]SED25248.1 membrane fusion protein, multidrug efflux system [Rhizobiales bacterium GAS188]
MTAVAFKETAERPKTVAHPRNRARFKRLLVRFVLLVLVPLAVLGLGLFYYLSTGRYVSTDNAYVGSQRVLITPDVSGKVIRIAVQEGQHLSVGDVLFEIDPVPYRIAVTQAEARLALARTEYDNLRTLSDSFARQIDLSRQTLALRQADLKRKSDLLGNNAGSKADLDNSAITVAAARTGLEQLEQQLAGLRNQLLGRPDLPFAEFPPGQQAQAALDSARRDLANTVLKAPIKGIATQVTSIQMGRYISAGNPIFSVVADDQPWVDANPKETDLTYVREGQKVTVSVDAYPDRVWHGTVAAISPGTGAQFSILPPQNASGNWVKVVQRVPLRIEFAPGEDTSALRSGMSTVVEIDTGRRRSVSTLLGALGLKAFGATPAASP